MRIGLNGRRKRSKNGKLRLSDSARKSNDNGLSVFSDGREDWQYCF
jgi:hypothetical protein